MFLLYLTQVLLSCWFKGILVQAFSSGPVSGYLWMNFNKSALPLRVSDFPTEMSKLDFTLSVSKSNLLSTSTPGCHLYSYNCHWEYSNFSPHGSAGDTGPKSQEVLLPWRTLLLPRLYSPAQTWEPILDSPPGLLFLAESTIPPSLFLKHLTLYTLE